jgi:NAD(P)H-hydrate epimerase
MQAIERQADAQGLSYEQMMENAGRGLAEIVASAYSLKKQEGVLGLVGSGNNGGDTLVALAELARRGWRASAYLVRPRPGGDPLAARLAQAGGRLYRAEEDAAYDLLRELLNGHAVILDGVLGTGIRLPLKLEVAVVLDTTRRTLEKLPEAHVVAVDCPSGMDLDTGEAAPEAVPAERTVTMAAAKVGMLKFPAFHLLGELQKVSIGLPDEAGKEPEVKSWEAIRRSVPEESWVREALPERPADAHKGTFGTALIAAGSVHYTGAALLAGRAAYRSGAGLVTLAVPAPLHTALAGHFPEATWEPLAEEDGFIDASAAEQLEEHLAKATAFLIGPGFGLKDQTEEFLSRLLVGEKRQFGFVAAGQGVQNAPRRRLPPLVLDADGLKLLARLDDWPEKLPGPAILTPHPGEMAILTGLSKEAVQDDRLDLAERFAREWEHVVVLKGAFTVIAGPGGDSAVIPVASAALARAGTGDVLAGLIAGLLAQGMEPYPAAVAGAWIHAQAGLEAANTLGNPASVLAGDLLDGVVRVFNRLLAGV